MRNCLTFLLLLGSGLLLSNCALIRPMVEYSALLPSEVQLKDVNTIAVLEFAVPLGNTTDGRQFAKLLFNLFSEQSHYRMVSPEQSMQIIKSMNIPLSRFRDAETIQAVGKAIGVHALLFGDLTDSGLQSYDEKEKVMQQVGVRSELWKVLYDSDGNTKHAYWNKIPLYEEKTIHHINRYLTIHSKARLIRVSDGTVLWENESDGKGKDTYEFEEQAWPGVPLNTENGLRQIALHQAGQDLIRELLPRQVMRKRQLAAVKSHDVYSRLIEEGNKAALQNDWNSAGRYWLKAIASNPDAPEAYANLGILYEGAQDFQTAYNYLQKAAHLLGEPWLGYADEIAMILRNYY